jgi:hypothetical protein
MAANMWRKGTAPPNPAGRGGLYQQALRLARDKSTAAVERMVQLAELDQVDEFGKLAPLSPDADPRVAALAAQWVFERAWGRVRDYDPTKVAGEPPLTIEARRAEAMETLKAAFERVLAAQAPQEDAAVAQPAGEKVWCEDADEIPSS